MYGQVTPSLIGIALKEMVRRAIKAIRNERFVFDAQSKEHYSGALNDLVTSADKAAQRIYVKAIRECFPGYGVVAEEDNLRIPCTIEGEDLYFTVDPLDGTKAFARRQSTGVGTMIALMRSEEVIAAYVGDVMTQELYGFRPDSNKAHRISEFEISEELIIRNRCLKENGYLLLRANPWDCGTNIERLRACFQGIEIEGGSIGISFARLWKQEVAAVLMQPGYETPWDTAPIVGISRKLGFAFLEVGPSGALTPTALNVPREVEPRNTVLLVVHPSHVSQLVVNTL
jgi:fructose-1,6-bisphosphatase/inositol monophosphatase family enzyme